MGVLVTHLDASGTEISVECATAGGVSKYQTEGEDPSTAFMRAMELGGSVATQLARQVTGAMQISGAVVEASFAVKLSGKGIVMISQTPNDGQFNLSIKFSPPKR
jgi:hypothetical protein